MQNYHAQAASAAQQAQNMRKGIPDGFEPVHRCGEGTYGLVHLCKAKNGRHVAIKTLKSGQEGEGISITAVREAMLLKELHHPNILHLESVHLNRRDGSLSLVFEFVTHDLFEMIQHHKSLRNYKPAAQHFPKEMVKSIMWQMLRGLAYLHENWIIHRDLKPSNLLVMGYGEANEGQLRVADFGLARVYRSPTRPLCDNGVVVTIWYRAPELLFGAKHYTCAVDMWAAACIFGELLTLKPLFHGEEVRKPLDAFQHDQLHKVFMLLGPPDERQWPDLRHLPHWKANTKDVRSPRPEHRDQLEQHLLDCNPTLQGDPSTHTAVHLLKQMLHWDPKKRPTAAEALDHEYFKQDPPPSMNVYPANFKVRYASKMQNEAPPKNRHVHGNAARALGQPKRGMPPKR